MPAQIRIRMYRSGFGDCFLVSFGGKASARHVLIDFGAHHRGEIGTMEAIMDDIEAATGKRLAIVVASHAHRDHISGFGKFEARFAGFDIEEIWMPWPDDPSDRDAARLQKKQLALYDRLDRHLRLRLGASESDKHYAAALDALSNLRGNEPAKAALARGFGVGTPRYLKAGDSIARAGKISGLTARILGPSKDQQFLSRMDPPAKQRYLGKPGDLAGEVHPFPTYELSAAAAEFRQLVANDGQPEVPPGDLDVLHESAEAPADRLALALDNVRNNTSLVVAFRFGGKTLLFPGDAQWGGWQSWIGTAEAKRLIGEVDFLKLSHHGSHNGTPVDVVDALRASGLVAMASTQVKPFPTIPRKPLVAAVEKHCVGKVVVRSDWVKVAKAPAGPAMPARNPKGVVVGKYWVDCQL